MCIPTLGTAVTLHMYKYPEVWLGVFLWVLFRNDVEGSPISKPANQKRIVGKKA